MEPLVSVVIPTYNRARFVGQAVASVLNQTYKNIEIIVVDDGSRDNTAKVLEPYDGKIEYVYQERAERSRARNVGILRSKGDYIALLDSDDLWASTKIEKQVQVLNEKPKTGVVYTDVQFIDVQGNPYEEEIRWDVPRRKALYEDLMTNNVITGSTSSVMIRRTCLDEVGLFDESMNACEDLDLYRRLARYHRFHKIDLPLVKIRMHGENSQSDLTLMAQGWETTINRISHDTPSEFEYYKYEAILKILSQTLSLYREAGCTHCFLSFCAKSAFRRPNWILRIGFWWDLLVLGWKEVLFKTR